METIRQYSQAIVSRMKKIVSDGNIHLANEIAANIMVGSMILIVIAIMLLCLVLNEVGVFTADPVRMRYCAIVTLAIEIPVLLISKAVHSEPGWVKYMLSVALVVMCANLSAVLTHNVVLATALPMIMSVRYYDEKFSARIAGVCVVAFTAATILSARYGITNLNVYHLAPGTVLTIGESTRQALTAIPATDYLKSLLLHDYLPRFLVFSVIAITCARIALRGRQMVELQIQTSQKSSRIETELNLATEIQASMLPCIFPAFPTHTQLELFAKNTPAKEVGGDFYDYFIIDDDHVALVMADVSGKGVGAALFMTISKIVLKNQLLLGLDPAAAMTNANEQLCENNEAGLFVTTWAGVYEVSTGRLKYTNAGHNPPILRRKGQPCAYLTDRHGFVMAGFDGTRYRQSETTLSPGDELFLYTDGVTEATDPQEKLYGEDRLLAMMDRIADRPVRDQVQAVMEDIDLFVSGAEQFDDITMMGMRITE